MSSTRTFARSFNGGELTPEFFGQIADNKYQTGLALARNVIVLPHGPVANRPGFAYTNTAKTPSKKTRVIPFSYSTTQTMVIELGNLYCRFHTNGATLLAGSPAAYNAGTTYAIGDLVSSGGINYYSIQAGNIGNTPVSSPTFWYALPSAFYEIPSPLLEADLFDVHYVQSQDVLTQVHPNYAPMELRRLGATNWTLTPIVFATTLTTPTGVTVTPTGTGATSYSYLVTGVSSTGLEESLVSSTVTTTNNLLTTGNSNKIAWSSSGATRYNVYELSNGLFGFIGQTAGLNFVDNNITPDISKTPPIPNSPFGTTNNEPQAVTYFEQRRAFAGTNNNPQTINLTHSGTESNMAYSLPTRDDDAITFRIAAREANTIRHLVPLTNLVLLTSSAEWRVTSINSDAITPTSFSVTPQSYVGSSNVQPVIVNNNIIFAAARGGHMREMVYQYQYGGYVTGDLSLRAPHLFDGFNILDMGYSKSLYPIVWAPSSSGNLLGLTYVPEQQIGAWARHDSYTKAGQSLIESVAVVAEGAIDAVYCVINRTINGTQTRYIERMGSRLVGLLRDSFFVDAGVTYNAPMTVTGITQASPGVVTVAAHGLVAGNTVRLSSVVGMTQVNDIFYKVGTTTTNTFQILDLVSGAPIDTTGFGTYVSGGNARKAITTISGGISHLEGEVVNILTDGAVHPQRTVTGGSITLDYPAGVIQIGLPITADIQTLPLAIEAVPGAGQGRRKNVNKVWLRVNESSGINVGPTFARLTPAKTRTTEPFGAPPNLITGEIDIPITPTWGQDGSVCIRQSDPLPLTLVSMSMEVAIGA